MIWSGAAGRCGACGALGACGRLEVRGRLGVGALRAPDGTLRGGFVYVVHARLHSGDDMNLGISIQNIGNSDPPPGREEDGEGGTAGGGWYVPPDEEWSCWEE
jgi:hypothetical protein